MRSAALLFGILAIALGGCGTASKSARSQPALLASAGPIPAPLPAPPPAEAESPAPAPAAVAAALPAEGAPERARAPRPEAEVAPPVPRPPFAPVAFEAIQPGASPSYMVAYISPVIGQRGTPAPPIDPTLEEYDPWEPFNERMFSFNYNLDRYVVKPVATGYNTVMPDRVQQMVDNGFQNINLVPKVVNNLLQWNLKGMSVEVGRFLINSTLGIGGLFDIAKQEFGLEKTKVDFGQTLGKWGWGPGAYLVLPFLPPLTVRDGIGYGVDGAMNPLNYVLPFIWDRIGMKVGDTINDRSLNLDLFQGFEEGTVDLYSAVRNGYLQRRQKLIKGQ
jgi:phospholipid-binding lipoprotein MlaA